jgi:hypothetical protein
MKRLILVVFGAILLFLGDHRLYAQSMTGTNGLFHTPNGYVNGDRTLSSGLIYIPAEIMPNDFLRRPVGPNPYNGLAAYVNYVFIPRVEIQFRFTGNLGMEKQRRDNTFMDRVISARIQLLRESNSLPAVVFGIQDYGSEWFNEESGSYFAAHYTVASKQFHVRGIRLGLHTGYAFDLAGSTSKAFDGPFGGIEIAPLGDDRFSLIGEYDSFRMNTAVKGVLLKHVYVIAGLWNMKTPAGSVGITFRL